MQPCGTCPARRMKGMRAKLNPVAAIHAGPLGRDTKKRRNGVERRSTLENHRHWLWSSGASRPASPFPPESERATRRRAAKPSPKREIRTKQHRNELDLRLCRSKQKHCQSTFPLPQPDLTRLDSHLAGLFFFSSPPVLSHHHLHRPSIVPRLLRV
jgi:hypothetical protein